MIKFLILSIFLIGLKAENTINWNKLINKTHVWSNQYSNELRERFQLISDSKNISIECKTSIWQTVNGIQNLEVWAIDMINSWGSFPPSGVRIGTSTDFGSYDQCLAIEPNPVIDKPQYCLIDVKPPIPKPMPKHHNLNHRIDILTKDFLNYNKSVENVFTTYSEFASFFYWISLRTGVCTPSKCTESDISLLAEGFADSYGLELNRVNCETLQTETILTPIQVIAILFLSCVSILSLTATILEKFSPNNNKTNENSILMIFSLKRNLKTLLSKRSSEALPCLHGIRVITMVWVIFGHSTEFLGFQLYSRSFKVKEELSEVFVQLVLNAFFAVETFFFIGGMLTSYITFQYTGGRFSNFSVIGFLLSRFIRLTPQISIFILLTFLLPVGGWFSGPIWSETITPIIDNCSTNWWWSILHIQNWFSHVQICGMYTWYIACDMQFHWLSLLLIAPLLYNPKIGVRVTYFSIIFGYLLCFAINYYLDLSPGTVHTARDQYYWDNFLDTFYYRPFSHSSSFLIGFLFGFVAYKKMFRKLNKIPRYLFFALIISGYIVCLMDTYYWNTGKPYNRFMSAFIYSTSHLVWPASTAGLIWMCISGNGGIINSILSAHIFTPFSRLTYSAYLIHGWIIWTFIGTRRHLIDINKREIFYVFIQNLILVYFVAFLFALLFETPVLKLQKVIQKKIQYLRKSAENSVGVNKKDNEIRIKLNDTNNNFENQ